MQQSISRLSSGLRVQSAADNAAGMLSRRNMRAQQGGYKQAMRNANDGVAVLQTAESGYQNISDLLVRMREKARSSGSQRQYWRYGAWLSQYGFSDLRSGLTAWLLLRSTMALISSMVRQVHLAPWSFKWERETLRMIRSPSVLSLKRHGN